MANVKITALPAVAATPLSGAELLEIVQLGVSSKVTSSKLAAAFSTDPTNILPVTAGGTGAATLTGYVKGTGTTAMTAAATVPAADISGTLTVAQGGTGAATLTGYVKGTGTTAMTAAATVPVADISGTLPVTNGGTGAATLTGYVKGAGTAAMTASATIPWADISGKPTNYGAFYDATTQTAAINTATIMLFGNVSLTDGVTMAGGSRATVPVAGIYNFQFSAQFVNTSAADVPVSIWFRLNGLGSIANSCTDITVPKKDGAINGYAVAAWNYMETLAAGDYIEIMWSTPSASVYIEYIGTRTSPTRPAAPSVILTVEQVS